MSPIVVFSVLVSGVVLIGGWHFMRATLQWQRAVADQVRQMELEVALLSPRPRQCLARGQVGRVCELPKDRYAVVVEFSDLAGQVFARIAVHVSELLVLRREATFEGCNGRV